jgi:tight adherence protein C
MQPEYILVALVTVSVALLVYALMPGKPSEKKRLQERLSAKGRASRDAGQSAIKKAPAQSTMKDVMEKVAPYAVKPVMPTSAEEMSRIRERLAQAGFRRESTVRTFLASKTILGLLGAAGALAAAWGGGYGSTQLFGIVVFAGGAAFMLPNFWLSIARGQRIEKIRNGLPDSLDLLVVSVEAGLAFDAGIQRVADEMREVHPELSEEMQIASLETQMGIPRAEALVSMASRSGVDEVRALVSTIVQAERFGTSVAKTLRTQAESLRIKRRLKAEERAQQTAVKLLFPLILFIFPSLFVVMLGPAVLDIMKVFGQGGPLG